MLEACWRKFHWKYVICFELAFRFDRVLSNRYSVGNRFILKGGYSVKSALGILYVSVQMIV